MEPGGGASMPAMGGSGVRHRGNTFLDSKGFGWLMEVNDDDDEDSQVPLLYVVLFIFVNCVYVSMLYVANAFNF